MPAEWWFEAKTEEDAIQRGIEELGLTRDEVDVVEVEETDKGGILGLIGGGKRVRVLLRVKQDWKASWAKQASQDQERDEQPEAPEAEAEAEGEDGAALEEGPPMEDEEGEEAERISARGEEGEEAPPRPRRGRPAPARPVGEPSPEAIEVKDRAEELLRDLLTKMGMPGEIAAYCDAEGVHLEIQGEHGGILIGRRGATLDAIQYMVNRVVSRGRSGAVRIFVDAEGYRARRHQQVEDMALRMADRARKTGKPVTVKNLSARERRIVHQALQKERAISTKSVGEGEDRKLLIIPRRSGGGKHHGA